MDDVDDVDPVDERGRGFAAIFETETRRRGGAVGRAKFGGAGELGTAGESGFMSCTGTGLGSRSPRVGDGVPGFMD